MSTWFDASTGTFVSWLTGTACSFTPRRFAYSCASSQAGPLQASPWPLVFSTSHGALARTPTRSTPAFLIASIRGLVPGAGTGTSASTEPAHANANSAHRARKTARDIIASSSRESAHDSRAASPCQTAAGGDARDARGDGVTRPGDAAGTRADARPGDAPTLRP